MRSIEMVDLKQQYLEIKQEVDEALQEVIDDTAFINGEAVQKFCAELEYYLQSQYVVPCASGTDALQIALMSIGIEPGDEVITPVFTFVATAETVALLGGTPVFVDVDPDTFNINVEQVKDAVTDNTKAIIPVHLFGQSADLAPLLEIGEQHDIPIIEDNAQSIGAEYQVSPQDRRKTGTIGDLGCFSFFPSKNLGGFGDGGAICTNDKELAQHCHQIANHGTGQESYQYEQVGVNSRLNTLQAAVLRVKLQHLDTYNRKRQQAARFYTEALGENESLQLPQKADYSSHVYHQYTLRVPNHRNELQQELQNNDIPCKVYYPSPLHLQPAYEDLGYRKGDFPVAERLSQEVLSLPMHTELEENQLRYITDTVTQLWNEQTE